MTDNGVGVGVDHYRWWQCVQCMMTRLWVEQWLDLVGYEVTLEKMCFKNLSEWRSRNYGLKIWMSNRRLFQTVGPVKEKNLSPKVFLFVVGTPSVKLSEDKPSWWGGVYLNAVILTDTSDHLQKGSNNTEWDLVLDPAWYWNQVKGIQNRCDVVSPRASKQQARQQHSAPSGVYQWDSWVLLQARSYNSHVFRAGISISVASQESYWQMAAIPCSSTKADAQTSNKGCYRALGQSCSWALWSKHVSFTPHVLHQQANLPSKFLCLLKTILMTAGRRWST